METAISQVIGQLSGYMRGLTQRLDPGTGWYGEFLRRDPEGMRACLDGAAMPPWDVLESLLGDLAATTGAVAIARETQYAAGLRAVGVWDRLPGGVEELRTLLASAAEQQARARAALRVLSARLAESADPAEAEALSRELSWTRDDAARAAARHEDLTARLRAVTPGPDRPGHQPPPDPLNAVPAQRAATSPGATPATAWPGPREGAQGGSTQTGPRDAAWAGGPGDARGGTPGAASGVASGRVSGAASGWASDGRSDWVPDGTPGAASGRMSGAASDGTSDGTPGATSDAASGRASAPASGPAPEAASAPEAAGEPVGRAEGRWLRGARRSGGARYAGAAAPEARAVSVPPGHPASATPLRGARFGRPARVAADPAPAGNPGPEQDASANGSGHAGRAHGAPHEPARTASEVPDQGQPSAATGQGGRGPGAPAWSTGHAPSPGRASDPGLRPHPQGEPTPWPDRARADGQHNDTAQRAGSASGGGRQADAGQWAGSASGGGPQADSGQWAGSARADGPQADSAPWAGSAFGGDPQADSGQWAGSTRADGPQADSAPWAGSASGGDPQAHAGRWAGSALADGPHADSAPSAGSAPGGGPQGGSAQWVRSAPGGDPHGVPAQVVAGFVEGLVALRGQGRSGEAHALLCEAAAGPAERLVLLGEELARAGLAADWATLLWEAASLPPARFAAVAAVLGPADRDALLRQGAARPAAEIAEIALVLGEAGHTPEADALLTAFVRVRTAEESARLARRDPRWFAPRLLRAAEALSGAHHRDLLHALRVANLPVG
ncbi:hypothetical protein ACE1OC_08695 [Streptomyces sp. DSM 116496]|uniref:hypothetical protein n=1 Tax=Streptomyces stoeckheimensis TaxID=3344656 RepID=UPI0038B3815B